MDLGFLLTISCVLTTIAMAVFIGVLLFFVRYGGEGVKMIIDRFIGGRDRQQPQPAMQAHQAPPNVASRRTLRERARQLDFPDPAGNRFDAQAANPGIGGNAYPDFPAPQSNQMGQPRQASLRPRGQYPEFNPQAAQGNQPGFQSGTPSLSPSRPFQQGTQFNPNPRAGQQQPPAFPRQGQQNPYGQQQQPPLNPQGQQNPYGQQQPNPQGQFPQQQQNPLGGFQPYRPPLRGVSVPENSGYNRPIGQRDTRKGDDRDYIYDDRSGGNFIDDVGDFIDNF